MKYSFLLLLSLPLISACGNSDGISVSVENKTDLPRSGEVVELSIPDIKAKLPAEYYYVTDASGVELPSQCTYDGKLIFQADVDAESKSLYKVHASDTAHVYPAVCTGRVYPERADDLAWENNLVGFRVYGPETQRKGEKAFGYDIFFKYRSDEPVLETLYGAQTSSENWRKVDSLRNIDPAQAQEFVNSFTYHIDHGQGMDCYAVGPTAGDGINAFLENDSLLFAWCYDEVEVLDQGPVRFTAKLRFAPRAVGSDSLVTEHRLLSLDRGSQLNHAKIWFDGLTAEKEIATSFPLRDDSEPMIEDTYIAYADPTQGPDNGKALLGLVNVAGFDKTGVVEKHVFGARNFAPADTLDYYWGFAWDRQGMGGMTNWAEYLERYSETKATPLVVEYK